MKTAEQTAKVLADGHEAEGQVVTKGEVAVLLKMSVRTVERMLAAGELKPIGRGWLVRFYLPDVVECLRNGNRKFGRRAALTGNPKSEVRNPKEGRKPKGAA